MTKHQTKTQKNIDIHIRLELTEACEHFLKDVTGFQWLANQQFIFDSEE